MNNNDRKLISKLKTVIEHRSFELEEVIDDLENRLEEWPENLRYSGKADLEEERISELRSVFDDISMAVEELERIINE